MNIYEVHVLKLIKLVWPNLLTLKQIIKPGKAYRHVWFDWASWVRQEVRQLIEQGKEEVKAEEIEKKEWTEFEGNELNTHSKVTFDQKLGERSMAR